MKKYKTRIRYRFIDFRPHKVIYRNKSWRVYQIALHSCSYKRYKKLQALKLLLWY